MTEPERSGTGYPPTRNTINLESAHVLAHETCAGSQRILKLHAPATAEVARPGSFVHLRCAASLPMRRPMSIMRVDVDSGALEILYKVHGLGTRLLAQARVGDELSLLGPIGVPFKLSGYRRWPLLIGGGVGIPPMIFLADHMRRLRPQIAPLVLMGSEVPFPFAARPSAFLVPGIPGACIASMPLIEDWGIPSRLASGAGFPGCYNGFVTDLARDWLAAQPAGERAKVELFACGPTPMLKAVARLAQEFALPCQISLEEYMACAVGGCAGCAVPVYTPAGVAMKRVCVDGPVFEAASIYPV
ncbi:MAG: oxidoreductase [Gammaproteobacteria bacterium RIFCSPLOWO2_02_FULL_61_13]|nr:MAG: oxidoreductase [Gammaproteobacteria bacterium RIFCSPLOWO2_02_FULL_61_13]